MNQETKLVGWFDGEPGDVRSFANESEARMFADGVFHGAAQYGCGSVEVYIQANGEIVNVSGEPIHTKRMAELVTVFEESK